MPQVLEQSLFLFIFKAPAPYLSNSACRSDAPNSISRLLTYRVY